jgi:phosphoglycerate dehydrogenase-like enzyme
VLKIAVPHTVIWEDSDWARLGSIGEVSHTAGYPASEADLIARIGQADIIIGADVEFSARVIEADPRLKMISIWSTGYDNVDLEAARQQNVLVSNVPGYSAYSVAEQAWAMVLHLAKRLAETDAHVRSQQFDWSAIRGVELYGKTVGIVGTGAIGSHSARIARGFGCRVLAHTKNPNSARAEKLGVTYVSLAELLAESDVILLHAPLTEETRGMIGATAFEGMANQPILVNTARAGLVEMEPAINALEQGRIRGLGLDVMWNEPPNWDDPAMQRLLAAQELILAPHNAAYTQEAFRRLARICLDNVQAFLDGKPTNVIV